MTREAVVRQILEGMPLSERTDVRCSRCGAHLEGADIELVARNVDAGGWYVVTVYDAGCAPETVPETPLGPSVLASARLGLLADVATQRHDPALLDVEIVDAALGEAPPAETDGGEVLIRDDDRATLDEHGIVRR